MKDFVAVISTAGSGETTGFRVEKMGGGI